MHEHAQLMEGAKNCVLNLTQVKEGENVLIWTDRSGKVDQQVIDVLLIVIEEAGAKTILLNEKPPIFRLGEKLSGPVRAALEKAASIDNIYIQQILFEHPVRITACICPRVELMASAWARFPLGLFNTIKGMVTEKARGGPFRLTDANGTDLTGTLKTWPSGQSHLGRPCQEGRPLSF